jgi:hypothetical protein
VFRKLTHEAFRGGRFLIVALVAAMVGGVTTAVVMAAIPDSNRIIHGCRANSGGSLRVIDSSATCKSAETALDWSQGNLAYARVLGDGTIDQNNSFNVTSISKVFPDNGSEGFCFTVNGPVKNIVFNAEQSGAGMVDVKTSGIWHLQN